MFVPHSDPAHVAFVLPQACVLTFNAFSLCDETKKSSNLTANIENAKTTNISFPKIQISWTCLKCKTILQFAKHALHLCFQFECNMFEKCTIQIATSSAIGTSPDDFTGTKANAKCAIPNASLSAFTNSNLFICKSEIELLVVHWC